MGGVKNWSVGAQRGRETQSARAIDNLEGAKQVFEFIVWKYRPTTREQYAQHLNEEGCPTPSGKAKWSGNLVHQYMRRLGQTPKSLLAEFPERTGIVIDYRAEVFAALRDEITRLNTPSEANGCWCSTLDVDPRWGQVVSHPTYGRGSFVERLGLTKLLCEFWLLSPEGSPELVERECRPADVSVFIFHLSAEERVAAQTEFWKRMIAGEKPLPRKLIDGWYR